MIYGLPTTTFVVAFGLPIVIIIILLMWGRFYNVEEDE
jgi:hypothetical protein